MNAKDPIRVHLRLARDVAVFVGGMGGIIYETLQEGAERPTLLILFAAMIGLPFALNADRKPGAPEQKPTEKQDA